jgi:hypothetical protein
VCDGLQSCDVNEDKVSVSAICALSHGARAVTVMGSLSACAHRALFSVSSDNWNLHLQLAGTSQPLPATEIDMQEVVEQYTAVERLAQLV